MKHDCPLKGRDPMPSCQPSSAQSILAHLQANHFANTGITPQSYGTAMAGKVSALRRSIEVCREELTEGPIPELTRISDELQTVSTGVSDILVAAARERMAANR